MATQCEITRTQFKDKAKSVCVQVAGQNGIYAEPRTFSSKSIGWYGNGKAVIELDGKPVKVQVGITVTVIGSKELPE